MNHQTNVLVVAGGLWQVPLIKYLKNKGHNVFVVDPYMHLPGVQMANKHIECDVRDYKRIIELLKNEKFEFITTDQSDVSVNTVARLNEYFNLPGNKMSITDKFVNKYNMRLLAETLAIPIPKFCKINGTNGLQNFIEKVGLPIILKPADSQASRGVIKIDFNNRADIENFVAGSLKYANCEYLIAEEFIDGVEITVEGFASNFKHRTLAISLKKHFRTGIASELRYPAQIPENIYKQVEKLNDTFVEKSGLRFGITHAEYIINLNTEQVVLIEIACRGGGTLISSDIVNWVSGVNVYDHYYANLKGGITDVKKLNLMKRHAILKFFEFKTGKVKSISGFDEVKKIKEVISCNFDFKPGDMLHQARDDRSRQGYFIAFADDKFELDKIINKISNILEIKYE